MSKWVTPETTQGTRLEQAQLRVTDDIEKFANDEINTGQLTARILGEGGKQIGDAVGDITTPILKSAWNLLPEGLQKVVKTGASHIAEGVMDTAAAKKTMQLMEDDPELARDIGSLFNMVDLAPVAALAKGGTRQIMQNVVEEIPTKLPGFYEGGPQAVQAFGKGAVQGLPQAIKRPFSPQARANAEVKGTGVKRIEEATEAIPTESRGSLMASNFMRRQADKRTTDQTLIDIGPTSAMEVKGVPLRLGSQRDTIKQQLKSDVPDVPDEVVEKFLTKSVEALEPGKGKLAKARRSVFSDMRARKPEDTQVVVRDLGAKGSDLRGEALVNASINNRALLTVTDPDLTKKYAAFKGKKELEAEDLGELVRASSAFERGNWKNTAFHKEVSDIYGDIGQKEAMDIYLGAKLAQKRSDTALKKWEEAPTQYYKNNTKTAKKGDPKPKPPKPTSQLTAKQKKYMDLVDKQIAKNPPNMIQEGDFLYYTTSYASQAKDLGGVGSRMAINTKTGDVYNMILDGHDIFDIDPAGGDSLFNFTPIQKRKVGGGDRPDLTTPQSALDKAEEGAKRLEEATGMLREKKYATRKSTRDGKVYQKGDLLDVEDPIAFEKRVLRDYDAPVEMRHRMDAAGTGMLTGVGLSGNLTQNEEQSQ